MPRFIVPVSTRTTNGTLFPAVVVVLAASAGIAAVPGIGLKSFAPFGR